MAKTPDTDGNNQTHQGGKLRDHFPGYFPPKDVGLFFKGLIGP